MKPPRTLLYTLLPLTLLCFGAQQRAVADSTYTGTFTNDSQYQEYDLSVVNPATYTLYTTSYGGGANLDGTTSVAGGFVPVLTLFSATTGQSVGVDGGGGLALGCRGGAMADAGTGMCDDAYLQLALTSGDYKLYLSEFPNFANGTADDPQFGFTDPNFTAGFCDPSAGSGPFLETDVAPCVQRNGSYAVNVTSAAPVPEPPTWALMLPAVGVLFITGRQHLS